jgi:hypothetical protein
VPASTSSRGQAADLPSHTLALTQGESDALQGVATGSNRPEGVQQAPVSHSCCRGKTEQNGTEQEAGRQAGRHMGFSLVV